MERKLKELDATSQDLRDSTVVGGIGNYYGSLHILEKDGVYYFGIENYSGMYMEEIPKSLYNELLKYNETYPDKDYN